MKNGRVDELCFLRAMKRITKYYKIMKEEIRYQIQGRKLETWIQQVIDDLKIVFKGHE